MDKFPRLCVQKEKGRSDRYYCWIREEDRRRKVVFGSVEDPASIAKYKALRAEWEAGRETALSTPTPTEGVS